MNPFVFGALTLGLVLGSMAWSGEAQAQTPHPSPNQNQIDEAQLFLAAVEGNSPALHKQVKTWSPEINAALDHFLSRDLHGEVAVFDADGTLWHEDVGEAFLHWLIDQKKLHMPSDLDVYAHYEALCAQDKMIGYPYAAQAMAGMSEAEVRRLAANFFADHFRQNIYPGQRALIERLQRAGVQVWIVSASNQWLIEAAANYLGVPAAQVVGIRLGVERGLITDKIIPPVTYRQGKVEAIRKYIGKRPILVSGDSLTDYEMLLDATQMRLVINPKDKGPDEANIYKLARQHGWLIQRW